MIELIKLIKYIVSNGKGSRGVRGVKTFGGHSVVLPEICAIAPKYHSRKILTRLKNLISHLFNLSSQKTPHLL